MEEADEIFKTRNAFSSVGGEFYCTKVLMAIGNVITAAINEESERSMKKSKKYLSRPEGDSDDRVLTDGDQN